MIQCDALQQIQSLFQIFYFHSRLYTTWAAVISFSRNILNFPCIISFSFSLTSSKAAGCTRGMKRRAQERKTKILHEIKTRSLSNLSSFVRFQLRRGWMDGHLIFHKKLLGTMRLDSRLLAIVHTRENLVGTPPTRFTFVLPSFY